MAEPVVLGLDVGTGGARGVAVTGRGEVMGAVERPLPAPSAPRPGWREQRPDDWWRAVAQCLGELCRSQEASPVAGVCVDSTSGTIVAVDETGRPLRNAILYNDARAAVEADELNEVGAELAGRMGYRFNSSYGLAKILWIARHEPAVYEKARFLNAADAITGRLAGEGEHTDYTNALKMGYDLLADCWPGWLDTIGVAPGKLPRVLPTGDIVGRVSASAAGETGLPPGTPLIAGPTDGVAAFYASGATSPGDAATALGTTLVVKSVSGSLLRDPKGRIYCHKHAEGHWLPGGASNCGCGYADRYFPRADLEALGEKAREFLPCEVLLYPLPRTGERFPVVFPEAERVLSREPRGEAEHFAAYLQGVAFVERWAYETVAELGGAASGTVFSAGGGSRSEVWMQVRADALGRETARAAAPDSAFGSAVLAASHTLHGGVREAAAAMVKEEKRFIPRRAMRRQYDSLYRRFRAACAKRGLE